jgi:hypothetical protein
MVNIVFFDIDYAFVEGLTSSTVIHRAFAEEKTVKKNNFFFDHVIYHVLNPPFLSCHVLSHESMRARRRTMCAP